MNKSSIEFWKELKGSEISASAFGKRFGEQVVVMVEYPFCIHNGKKFKPTVNEWKELEKDYLRQEYGTTDMNQIMKMEGF